MVNVFRGAPSRDRSRLNRVMAAGATGLALAFVSLAVWTYAALATSFSSFSSREPQGLLTLISMHAVAPCLLAAASLAVAFGLGSGPVRMAAAFTGTAVFGAFASASVDLDEGGPARAMFLLATVGVPAVVSALSVVRPGSNVFASVAGLVLASALLSALSFTLLSTRPFYGVLAGLGAWLVLPFAAAALSGRTPRRSAGDARWGGRS